MRTKNYVITVILMATLSAAPSVSRAEIVETIIDTDSNTAIGTIGFPGLTGSTATGVELSLGGFTQTDITSISWTLDSSTYAVDALDLNARTGAAACGFGMNCSFSVLSLSATDYSRGGGGCSYDPENMTGICEEFFFFPTPVTFVVTSVPEPSTWAMMVVGFAGLGFAGYRASRRAVA
jgi:PEP-CTERM motif